MQPIPHYLDLVWNTLSCAAKEEHTRNAVEAVSLVLRALAPSQKENLWEAVTESHQLSTGCNVKEDVALESTLLAYRECINRATKTQILSLISTVNMSFKNCYLKIRFDRKRMPESMLKGVVEER